MLKINRKVMADVLVIGGGGAAVTAAVSAARNGAAVAIVSKGKIGNSGNTIMIGGSYGMDGESAAHKFHIQGADPLFTKQELFESIVKDGFYLSDQNMVEQFVEESPDIVYEVKEWGEEAGQYYQFYSPSMWNVSGRGLGRSLQQGLQKTKGIDSFEDMAVFTLLKAGGRVNGALALDLYRGEIVLFEAGAVVMATGGFQPFSLKNTNSDMTGDGLAMAYRAGATLSDLEFMLFLITAIEPNEMKGSILPVIALFREAFDYDPVDRDGRQIQVPKKLRAMEKTSEMCKLVHIYYYGKAIACGRGTEKGGIYFDFSRFTDEEIDRMFEAVMDHFDGFYKRGYYHGDSVTEYKRLIKEKRRIQVGLANEYTVGGILVDEKMATDVPGLYAAGECSSGVFGACRVADAVTEMITQGVRAGTSAAAFAALAERKGPDEEELLEGLSLLEAILKHEGGIAPGEARKRLEAISDKAIGLIREEESLREGLALYEQLEREMGQVTIREKSLVYNRELLEALETENRLLCARLAARMALERRESRGLHIRSDCPFIDNENWLVRQMIRRQAGKDCLTKREPVVTRMPLCRGGKEDYEEYLLREDLGMTNMEEK